MLLGALVSGCGDHGTPGSEAIDSGLDAAPRVKERTVQITLPPVARRSFEAGPDGDFDFGELEMLDGAESCVVQRREAFATFEPFEPLERPLCVTTKAGEDVRIEDVPANSDVVITVEKEGYSPSTLTFRVGTLDVPKAFWVGDLRTVLFEPGQVDPWREEAAAAPADAGTMVAQVTMSWGGPGVLTIPRLNVWAQGTTSANWTSADGMQVTVELASDPGAEPIELSTSPARPSFVALRPGSYRVRVTHPRARCEPSGVSSDYTPWGLSGDRQGEIELPVLAGHSAALAPNCWCFPPRADAVPLDLASCTFAEDGGAP